MDIQSAIQSVISGLQTGSIYALIGVGFACAYSGTRCVNFAQGEFSMLGAMLAVVLMPRLGMNLFLSCLCAVAITTIIGVVCYRMVVRRLQDRPLLAVLGTIGLSAILRGIAALLWHKDTYKLPNFTSTENWVIGGVSVSSQFLWILIVLLLLSILLFFFFKSTLAGRALIASSINPRAATLCGISPVSIGTLAFGLAAAVGAIAGIVITPITFVSYDSGLSMGLRGFCCAALGGMRSLPAIVFGGILLGILESLTARYYSSSYKDLVIFLLLISVLVANARLLRLFTEDNG